MPIARSRIPKPVPVMVSRDTAVERSIAVFLNDVDRYSVSCDFCPMLTTRSFSTDSLLAADAAIRHDQPDTNLT